MIELMPHQLKAMKEMTRYLMNINTVVNGEPSDNILIIARSKRYSDEWCRIHNVNPLSSKVRVATSIIHFMGIDGFYYVDLGTDKPYLRSVIESLKSMNVIRPFITPSIEYEDKEIIIDAVASKDGESWIEPEEVNLNQPHEPFYVDKRGDIAPLKYFPQEVRDWWEQNKEEIENAKPYVDKRLEKTNDRADAAPAQGHEGNEERLHP